MFVFLISVIWFILFHNKLYYLIFVLLLLVFFKNKKRTVFLIITGFLFGFLSISINVDYDENITKFNGIVYERKDNYFLFYSQGRRYYVYQKNHQYEVFDILYIDGEQEDVSFAILEGEFDFNEYLFNKKVSKKINVNNIEFKWKNLIRKSLLIKKYLSQFDETTQDVIGKLFFGINSDLSSYLYEMNLSSYFSLTGIGIYFIYGLFYKLYLFILNDKKRAKVFSLLSVFPFMIFNNYKLSLLKNYLLLINQDNKKISNNLLIILILLCVIFINYRYIYTSSFLYLFVLPFVMKLFNNGINGLHYKERKFFRIVIFYLVIVVINLFLYGSYNLLSAVLYLFLMVIIKLFMVICLFSFLLPISGFVNLISNWVLNFISYVYQIPTTIYVSENNYVFLVIELIFIFLLAFCLELRLRKLFNMILSGYFISLSIFCFPFDAYVSQYVVFINVGQGDCALIHNRNINILIDVGGSIYKDIGNDVLIPYLKKNHINSIDCVFISHNDYDHIGSLESLQNSININEVILGSSFYSKVIGNMEIFNLNQYYFGYEDNENSSVLYFNFIGYNFLFMGDADIKVEKKIMDNYSSLDVDIIKVGHHGSSTSSSYDFLQYVMPNEAVISVGKNNYYNHPSDIVLKYLYSLDVVVRRTDIEGSIKYVK